MKSRQEIQFPVDLEGEILGFQVDSHGKVWVCVDGMCVMRVRGLETVEITDLRIKSDEGSEDD